MKEEKESRAEERKDFAEDRAYKEHGESCAHEHGICEEHCHCGHGHHKEAHDCEHEHEHEHEHEDGEKDHDCGHGHSHHGHGEDCGCGGPHHKHEHSHHIRENEDVREKTISSRIKGKRQTYILDHLG